MKGFDMRAKNDRPLTDELYFSSIPFYEAHPNYNINTLPSWIRENIESARVYG